LEKSKEISSTQRGRIEKKMGEKDTNQGRRVGGGCSPACGGAGRSPASSVVAGHGRMAAGVSGE